MDVECCESPPLNSSKARSIYHIFGRFGFLACKMSMANALLSERIHQIQKPEAQKKVELILIPLGFLLYALFVLKFYISIIDLCDSHIRMWPSAVICCGYDSNFNAQYYI